MREGYPSFDLIRRFLAGCIDASLFVAADYLYSLYLIKDSNLVSYWQDRYRFKISYGGQNFGKAFSGDIYSRETLFNQELFTERAVFYAGVFLILVVIYRLLSGSAGMRTMGVKHVSRFFSVTLKWGSASYCAFIATALLMLFGHDTPLFLNYFFGQSWLLWYPFAKFAAAAAFALWWLGFVMAQRLRLDHGSQSFFEQAAGLMTIRAR